MSILFLICIVNIDALFIYPPCPESECPTIPNSIIPSIGTDKVSNQFDLSNNRDQFELPTITSNQAPVLTRKIKTQQYYKNIPIFDASLIVEEDNDGVRTPIYGNWYNNAEIQEYGVLSEPTTTKDEALRFVLDRLRITSYDIRINISSELNIYYIKDKPFLVYIIEFTYFDANQPNDLFQPMAIVKATGVGRIHRILKLYNEPRTMAACGSAGNQKTGAYSFCKGDVGATWLWYNDKWGVPPKLQTGDIVIYDKKHKEWDENGGQNKVKCSKLSKWRCNVDAYDNPVNGGYGTAIDAFHHAKQTWNMYKAWMNEKPILYPKPFPIYVHVGNNWANAHFAWDRINIGDGSANYHPFVALDAIAHEIAHGYTNRYSNLVYYGESGGMNEAYSDIVGVCAKVYDNGEEKGTFWRIGYDLVRSWRWGRDALRYMWKPQLDGASIGHYCDYYNGLNVHYSSGVYNKAMYKMRYNGIRKWSFEEIFKVFSTANKYYWTKQSTMRQGLCGLLFATRDLYENKSDFKKMMDALKDAFAIVGLKCWSAPKC